MKNSKTNSKEKLPLYSEEYFIKQLIKEKRKEQKLIILIAILILFLSALFLG